MRAAHISSLAANKIFMNETHTNDRNRPQFSEYRQNYGAYSVVCVDCRRQSTGISSCSIPLCAIMAETSIENYMPSFRKTGMRICIIYQLIVEVRLLNLFIDFLSRTSTNGTGFVSDASHTQYMCIQASYKIIDAHIDEFGFGYSLLTEYAESEY